MPGKRELGGSIAHQGTPCTKKALFSLRLWPLSVSPALPHHLFPGSLCVFLTPSSSLPLTQLPLSMSVAGEHWAGRMFLAGGSACTKALRSGKSWMVLRNYKEAQASGTRGIGAGEKVGVLPLPPILCLCPRVPLPGTLSGPLTGFSQACLFTQQSEGSCSQQASSRPSSALCPCVAPVSLGQKPESLPFLTGSKGPLRPHLPLLTLLQPHWPPPSSPNPPNVLPPQAFIVAPPTWVTASSRFARDLCSLSIWKSREKQRGGARREHSEHPRDSPLPSFRLFLKLPLECGLPAASPSAGRLVRDVTLLLDAPVPLPCVT